MEEINEREKREKDDLIMSTDTSNMEPVKKAYIDQRKNEIFAKFLSHSINNDF